MVSLSLMPGCRWDMRCWYEDLLAAGCHMVRLVGLAEGAAVGRGKLRAAASWGWLASALRRGTSARKAPLQQRAAGEQVKGVGRARAGQAGGGCGALGPRLLLPCYVTQPGCSNLLCMSMEGGSEAGMPLARAGANLDGRHALAGAA